MADYKRLANQVDIQARASCLASSIGARSIFYSFIDASGEME